MKPIAQKFSVVMTLGVTLGLAGAVFGQTAPGPTGPATGSAPVISAVPAPASAAKPAATEVIAELHVGKDVYYDVKVLQVTPLTLVFSHRRGIASVALGDLPDDLQKRFGYDPQKALTDAQRRQKEADAQKRTAANAAQAGKGPPLTNAQLILQSFNEPPKIFAEVNMRPRFEALGIGAKNQDARPSSAIFALACAYAYQRAPEGGPAPEFSEEYLMWTTLKTLGKTGLAVPQGESATLDVGFTLPQVAEALRTYGVAFAEEVPYHFVLSDPHVLEPPAEVVDRAKKRSPADGFYVSGHDAKEKVANLVHVINAGVPVTITLNWPEQKDYKDNSVLDAQPGLEKDAHVVLLVGYRARAGKLEDTEFLFKNSYGTAWGDRGYGLVTYKYLLANLQNALFLDAGK